MNMNIQASEEEILLHCCHAQMNKAHSHVQVHKAKKNQGKCPFRCTYKCPIW